MHTRHSFERPGPWHYDVVHSSTSRSQSQRTMVTRDDLEVSRRKEMRQAKERLCQVKQNNKEKRAACTWSSPDKLKGCAAAVRRIGLLKGIRAASYHGE